MNVVLERQCYEPFPTQVAEWKLKCEAIEKREAERREADAKKHKEEVAFLENHGTQNSKHISAVFTPHASAHECSALLRAPHMTGPLKVLPTEGADGGVFLACSQATEATAGDFLCTQEVKLQIHVTAADTHITSVSCISAAGDMHLAVVLLCFRHKLQHQVIECFWLLYIKPMPSSIKVCLQQKLAGHHHHQLLQLKALQLVINDTCCCVISQSKFAYCITLQQEHELQAQYKCT